VENPHPTGELQAEKAKAKEIILGLKRQVEGVLAEAEASSAEARQASASALAACESELASQRANVEWLGTALERAEERGRAYEAQLATSGAAAQAERLAAAVAKARAPLELRNEGLAVRAPTGPRSGRAHNDHTTLCTHACLCPSCLSRPLREKRRAQFPRR
jgi:hypothetical protein